MSFVLVGGNPWILSQDIQVLRNVFYHLAALSFTLVVYPASPVVVCSVCGQLFAAINLLLLLSYAIKEQIWFIIITICGRCGWISLRKENLSLSDEDQDGSEGI